MDGTDKAKDSAEDKSGLDTPGESDQSSDASQETSGIDEGANYSGTDVKKLITDALAGDGRKQKMRADTAEAEVTKLTTANTDLTKRFDTMSTQVDEILIGREAQERDAVKDDPEALKSLDTKIAQAKTKREQDTRNEELNKREESVKASEVIAVKDNIKSTIAKAAAKAGVSAKALDELCPDGDAGRLARAAELLKKSGSEPDGGDTPPEKPSGLTQRPMSSRRTPGKSPEGMSSDEKIAEGLRRKKK